MARILIAPSITRKGAEFSDLSLSLSFAYSSAVLAAGGLPVIFSALPSAKAALESVRQADGLLLTGGDDIQPPLYGKRRADEWRAMVKPADPGRDLADLLLIEEIFRQKKPLLAICRGHQLVNVAFGGTLWMDLPRQKESEIDHRPRHRRKIFAHQVSLAHGSLLARIFGREKLWVNSSHHQAIDRLAEPFCATALSADGIIEAMELRAADRGLLPYFLSVQFHPERLIERHSEFLLLFKSFVRACDARPPERYEQQSNDRR